MQAGWDGYVECVTGNRFVPSGKSLWELSAQQSGLTAKASADYDKRLRGTPQQQRARMAYVAMICASWTKAREFADERDARDEFRLVRALNVDNIVDWLTCAPITTVWMRGRLAKPDIGVRPLSRWWEDWLSRTDPPLDERIVLAGRDNQVKALEARCVEQAGGVCTVGGDMTPDEITAFVAAALVTGAERGSVRGDALRVDDRRVLQQLLNPDSAARGASAIPAGAQRMVLTASTADCAECLPAGSPHLVIVAMPGARNAQIRLESVDAEEVTARLQAAGLDIHTAGRYGALARMSLPALVRQIAHNPELYSPAWRGDRLIRQMILMGRWDTRHEGDKQILQRFTGVGHVDLLDRLHGISIDPPLVLSDQRWHTASPSDAWDQIHQRITREELTEFEKVAFDVLTLRDPLQRDDRRPKDAGSDRRRHRGMLETICAGASLPHWRS